LTSFKDERAHYGQKKIEQIRHTQADVLVVPCHSCHGQIKTMAKRHGLPDLQVKYLWEVVADALIVNKRSSGAETAR
jgi:Fe-S oxidoreductase